MRFLEQEALAATQELIQSGEFGNIIACNSIKGTGIVAAGGIGLVNAEVSNSRNYEPQADGSPLIVIPVPSLHHCANSVERIRNAQDLVAFDPHKPSRWWLRLGYGDYLGWPSRSKAWHHHGPLFVHAHPLAWLQWGGEGICVLHDDHFYAALDGISKILTTAPHLERKIRAALRRPIFNPEIRVIGGGTANEC